MATHYVCPECGIVASIPKNCDTEGCHLQGRPLEGCSCTDGSHSMTLNDNA